MRELDVLDFRKDVDEGLAQMVGRPGGFAGNRPIAPAEENAPAIGRGAVVVVQPARLGEHHALRHELAHEIVRERRRRDDAAPHRHHAPAQPAVRAVRVAIRAGDHMACRHTAARRLDLVVEPVAANAGDGRLAVHDRAGAAREPQHSRMELRRMQPADVHAHGAAMIVVRAEVVALLGARHGVGLDAGRRFEHIRLAGEAFVVARRRGPRKATGDRKLALDAFARDELSKILARRLGLEQQRARRRLAELLGELIERGPEIAAGNAAIARRRTLAGAHLVEDLDAAPRPSERDCSGEPGIASPDDHDIALRAHGLARERRRGRGFPPIGIGSDHCGVRAASGCIRSRLCGHGTISETPKNAK